MTAECKHCEAGGNAESIIPLTSDEIHVWLTFCESMREERLLVAYRGLLNDGEKEEESRFYFAKDRQRYLVTRALVRTVLSRYAPVDPKDWVFSTNAYGQPHIVNPEATDGCLSFSVSHTQELNVLGVARGRSLGVDAENLNTRNISIDLAKHYFAPEEVAAVREVPHHKQQFRFLEYWTLKESYIKARGMGLSLPLDRFSFHFADDHTVDLVINSELKDDSSRWQFWQFQPTPQHLLAVCVEKLDAQSLRLLVRETIPTSSERIVAPQVLRTSEIPQQNAAIERHTRQVCIRLRT